MLGHIILLFEIVDVIFPYFCQPSLFSLSHFHCLSPLFFLSVSLQLFILNVCVFLRHLWCFSSFCSTQSYFSSYLYDSLSLSVSNGGFLSMSAKMPSQIFWCSGFIFAACSLTCVACCSLSFIVPFRSMLMTTCQAVRACAARRLPMSVLVCVCG